MVRYTSLSRQGDALRARLRSCGRSCLRIAPSLLFALSLGLSGARTARAADRIDTDGPDFVESSEVVGKGHFQFETGPAIEQDRRAALTRRESHTPTLLRYGLTENIEFRVESDYQSHSRTTNRNDGSVTTESTRSDTAIGLKWHSHDRDTNTGTPSISWIAHLHLPTGEHGAPTPGVRTSLRSVIGWDLPNNFTAGLMPGLKYDTTADGRRFVSGILGATIGRWWRDDFKTFVELAASQIAHARDGGVIFAWDAGAAYLLNDSWQIGGRFAVAANRNTPRTTLVISLAGKF